MWVIWMQAMPYDLSKKTHFCATASLGGMTIRKRLIWSQKFSISHLRVAVDQVMPLIAHASTRTLVNIGKMDSTESFGNLHGPDVTTQPTEPATSPSPTPTPTPRIRFSSASGPFRLRSTTTSATTRAVISTAGNSRRIRSISMVA